MTKTTKLFALALVLLPMALQAQDDDMYFASSPKKAGKATQQRVQEQPVHRVQIIYADAEADTIQGCDRDVDEYNRRGPASRQFSYQLPGNDTLYILEDTTVQTTAILNQAYADGYDEGFMDADDYYYARRLNRFGVGFHYGPHYAGFYDPWYYDSWYWGYDPYWYGGWGYYGWHHPYWSAYYGWPHYGWYDPYWYGGYYGGWYGGYYGGWYGGGHRYSGSIVSSRGGYTGRTGVSLGGGRYGGRTTGGMRSGSTRFGAGNNGYRFGNANNRTTTSRTGRVYQQQDTDSNSGRTTVRSSSSRYNGGSTRSNSTVSSQNRSSATTNNSTRSTYSGSSNSSRSTFGSGSTFSGGGSTFSGGSSGGSFGGGGGGGFSGGGGRRGR